MEETKSRCGNCENFVRHYVKFPDESYHAISYGHCTKPRLKRRFIDDKACQHWERKPETAGE